MRISSIITTASWKVWKAIYEAYKCSNDGHPDSSNFDELLQTANLCSSLLRSSIKICKEDELGNSERYEHLIEINECCILACSWKQEYGYATAEDEKQALIYQACGNYSRDFKSWFWVKEYTLNESAIHSRRNENEKYREEAKHCREKGLKKQREESERKAKEQKVRNETYWKEHTDEKQQLESELQKLYSDVHELENQISPFEKEITALKNKCEEKVPSEKEKDIVFSEISKLRNEQKNLGVFKGKEKKALQAQIYELNSRIPTINKSIEAEKAEQIKMCNSKISEIEQKANPIRDKITNIQKRIIEIKTELTKNR